MKALTLHQPWASLVIGGHKKNETRSWGTSYRGPLAIHAGKKWTDDIRVMCRDYHFEVCITAMGYRDVDQLPLGCVLGTVQLVDVVRITDEFFLERYTSYRERQFGNYALGRFAWIFEELEQFKMPVLARGYQGLWEWSRNE